MSMGNATLAPSTDNQPPPNWAWYTTLLLGGGGVAAALAWAVGIWFPGSETFLRTMGGVLQFLGVGSVAWGISEIRRSFGLRSTTAEIMAYWLGLARATGQRLVRLFRRRPSPTIVGAGAASASWVSTRGRARVRSGPQATIEQRVAQLERNVDGIEDRLDRTEDDLQRETEQRVQAITSERQAREAENKDIKQQLETFALGGLRLQTVGLVWLIAGITLATWSKELAS
jgi:hypothetical protein